MQFKYSMLKLCELLWHNYAYDSVVPNKVSPKSSPCTYFPLNLSSSNRTWWSLNLSRIQGRGNQEGRFQWQKNDGKESIFPVHHVRGYWHSLLSEKSVLGNCLSTKRIFFPIFYPKFMYLSFLNDYGGEWGSFSRHFSPYLCTLLCCPHCALKNGIPFTMNS